MDKMTASAMIAQANIPDVQKVMTSMSESRGRITVLSRDPSGQIRLDILKRISELLVGEGKIVPKSIKSSIGHLDGGLWYVVVKPSRITSSGFSLVRPGFENERNLLGAIKHVISMYGESIDIRFKATGGKVITVKSIVKASLGKGKSDVILFLSDGTKTGISIKQGTSFKWDSGERRFEKSFRKMLTDAMNSKKFEILPPAKNSGVWKINPACIRPMGVQDQHKAVFGDDPKNRVIVVFQRFSPSHFDFDGENGVLTVETRYAFDDVSDIPAQMRPVFLIRNDDSRNTYSGEYRGLRFEISPGTVGRRFIRV